MRVNLKHLEKCELWTDSILDTANKYDALSIPLIEKKISDYFKVSSIEPLTASEQEFLSALQKTVKENESEKN